jgi:mannose-1-phosphate guanylyltransferase/phosphomannomutase
MILAAGEATRLRPLSELLPKALVPIVNRPVMEYVVRLLVKHGWGEILANLCHLGEKIEAHFGSGAQLGAKIAYQREETLLGTAGSVKYARDFFDGTFLVIGCDDLTDVDLSHLLDFHRRSKALATIAVLPVTDTTQYGVVVTEADGRIVRFVEKPRPEEAPSNLANTGVYLFEPEIMDFIPAGQFYDFGRQVFPSLLEKGQPFYACRVQCNWRDIGTIQEYLQANFDLLDQDAARATTSGFLLGSACAAAPTADLKPPVALGDGATVGSWAQVGPHVVLGAGSHVGTRASLDRAVVWPDVAVESSARVSNAVVTSQGAVPAAR